MEAREHLVRVRVGFRVRVRVGFRVRARVRARVRVRVRVRVRWKRGSTTVTLSNMPSATWLG